MALRRALSLLVALAVTHTACTALRSPTEVLRDGGGPDAAMLDAPLDDAPLDDVPADAAGDPCALPPGERPVAMHGGGGEEDIRTATTWGCESLHVLAGNVIVSAGTLTIAPGTEVRAADGTMLLVSRGASIDAQGTAARPIVFTSNRDAGARAHGAWRGLVLLGGARTHTTNLTVDDTLDASDVRGRFGGGPSSPTSGTCGTLRYVRVEFAGASGDVVDSPSAGLTLAGCGSDTIVDFVQVHRSTDGLGLVGGSPLLTHVVVTRSASQAIEWTGGFAGALQYVVVQHPATGSSGVAVRGSNSAATPAAAPISRPEIFNLTLIGSGTLISGEEMGVQFSYGSHGEIRNSIIFGFPSYAADVRHPASAAGFSAGDLAISNSLIFGNGMDLGAQFPGATAGSEMDDSTDDDGGFDENTRFLEVASANRVQNPGLTGAGALSCPPAPCPRFTSNFAVIADGVYAAPSDPRLAAADYHGAFLRDAAGNPPDWDWTLGWVAFPAD